LEPIRVGDRQTELVLREATSPGNWSVDGVEKAGATPLAGFSLNVPSRESDLTRVGAAEIEMLLGNDSLVPIDRKADLRDALEGHWSHPIELFPFLMVLLLFVLAVENLLANKFYKREPEGEAAK